MITSGVCQVARFALHDARQAGVAYYDKKTFHICTSVLGRCESLSE